MFHLLMSTDKQMIYGPLTVVSDNHCLTTATTITPTTATNHNNNSDTYIVTVSVAMMIRLCAIDGDLILIEGSCGIKALFRIRCSPYISFEHIKLNEVIIYTKYYLFLFHIYLISISCA